MADALNEKNGGAMAYGVASDTLAVGLTNVTATLTDANASQVCVAVVIKEAGQGNVVSVATTVGGLAFAKRSAYSAGKWDVEIWYVWKNTLNDTLTVTFDAVTHSQVLAFTVDDVASGIAPQPSTWACINSQLDFGTGSTAIADLTLSAVAGLPDVFAFAIMIGDLQKWPLAKEIRFGQYKTVGDPSWMTYSYATPLQFGNGGDLVTMEDGPLNLLGASVGGFEVAYDMPGAAYVVPTTEWFDIASNYENFPIHDWILLADALKQNLAGPILPDGTPMTVSDDAITTTMSYDSLAGADDAVVAVIALPSGYSVQDISSDDEGDMTFRNAFDDGKNRLEFWYLLDAADAEAPENFYIDFSAPCQHTITLFAVKGVDQTTPFDAGGVGYPFPNYAFGNGVTPTIDVETTAVNTFIIVATLAGYGDSTLVTGATTQNEKEVSTSDPDFTADQPVGSTWDGTVRE